MPRAEAADPGWTSWGGHAILVYLAELDTCPRVLGVGVLRVLWVDGWQGKYGYTLSKELVAGRRICGEGAEGGGERGEPQRLD